MVVFPTDEGRVVEIQLAEAAELGDFIIIQGSNSGDFTLSVNNTGGSPSGPFQSLEVIQTPTPTGANFTLQNGSVEAGMFVYRLQRGTGGNATNWYLVNLGEIIEEGGGGGGGGGGSGSGGGSSGSSSRERRSTSIPELSNIGKAIVDTAGAIPATWFAELDTLRQRMGELRLSIAALDPGRNVSDPNNTDPNAPPSGKQSLSPQKPVELPTAMLNGDVWVRTFGRLIQADLGITGQSFYEYQYGANMGLDKAWRIPQSWLFTGLFGGYGRADRRFGNTGQGASNSIYGGLYTTWIADSGWYLDAVGKMNYFINDFAAVSNIGQRSSGNFDNWGYGFSLEGGRQFRFGKGWFLEPQLEFAYSHISASHYQTDNDINVALGNTDVFQGRAGFLAGYNIPFFSFVIQPYVKASFIQILTAGGTLEADGANLTPTLDGPAGQFGAGVVAQMGRFSQVYLDYSALVGWKYNQPWGVNLGFRQVW